MTSVTNRNFCLNGCLGLSESGRCDGRRSVRFDYLAPCCSGYAPGMLRRNSPPEFRGEGLADPRRNRP